MIKSTDNDWDAVRRVPLFSRVPPDHLAPLLAHAIVQEVPARTTLFIQGDPADRFYIVLDGWVKLVRQTVDGEETVIGVFAQGESFAEAAIFDSGDFPVNAEVVAPSRLLTVPAKPFLAALKDNPELMMTMLATLSRRLRFMVQQVEQLHAKSAPQRVGSFLLLLSPDPDVPATIELPYDKSLIAARLGMTPETFSRALAKLRTLGVHSKGHAIIVSEPDALHRYCNSRRGAA